MAPVNTGGHVVANQKDTSAGSAEKLIPRKGEPDNYSFDLGGRRVEVSQLQLSQLQGQNTLRISSGTLVGYEGEVDVARQEQGAWKLPVTITTLRLSGVTLERVRIEAHNLLIVDCGCQLRDAAILAERIKIGIGGADCKLTCRDAQIEATGNVTLERITLDPSSLNVQFRAGELRLHNTRVQSSAVRFESSRGVQIEAQSWIKDATFVVSGGDFVTRDSVLERCEFQVACREWTSIDTVFDGSRPVGALSSLRTRLYYRIRRFLWAVLPIARFYPGTKWYPNVRTKVDLKNVRFIATLVDSELIATLCKDPERVNLQAAEIDNDWETLRDNYTGPMLLIHLLLLLIFVLPIVAKVLVFEAATVAVDYAGTFGADRLLVARAPIWQILLFGVHRPDGAFAFTHAGLSLVLIMYNAARGVLTYLIGKLRSREEHLASEGLHPSRPHPTRYRYASITHKFFMRFAFFLAVAAFVWRAYDVLRTSAPVGFDR